MFICDATFLPFARMIYRWKNWILNIVYERHRIKLIIFIWCAWDRFRNDGLQYQFQCCDAFDLPTVMYDKWEHCCFSPPRESNCRRGKVLYTHTHIQCAYPKCFTSEFYTHKFTWYAHEWYVWFMQMHRDFVCENCRTLYERIDFVFFSHPLSCSLSLSLSLFLFRIHIGLVFWMCT